MKEYAPTEQLVIVLTEHPVFGLLLIPYTSEKRADGTVLLLEQAFHASAEAMSRMSGIERQAITIASHYTEKYLMEVYSREKTVSRFLRKLSGEPEKVRRSIRPFIEKKLQEMLALIRRSDIPLYQKLSGSKQLYAHHLYRIHPEDVEIRFCFHLDEAVFCYRLQCSYEGKVVSIREQKPAVVLTSSPASLLLGMELYFFPHIESARLLPFTKKETICAEATQADKYIENILIPTARYHEIEVEGLKFTEEPCDCEARLTVEETVYEEPLLHLSFHYGDETFLPGSDAGLKKIVRRKSSDEIVFFRRDEVKEVWLQEQLANAGLQRISEAHFRLSPDAPEKSAEEWIRNHRELLQNHFRLAGNMGKSPYCLDEIRIEQGVDDTPDWFELRITVVIGDIRLPFSRFRKHILEEKREFLLPDGRIILLPEEWFSKYANALEMGIQTETGIRLKRSFAGVVQSALESEGTRQAPVLRQLEEIPAPASLDARLRPYQQKGFSWLVYLYEQGFGGCLADDMGLGKTLQTLALLQYIYQPSTQAESDTAEMCAPPVEPVKVPEADEDGQFLLFSFDTEEDWLPAAQEIRGKESPKADYSPRQRKTARKPATLVVVPTSLLHNWRREAKRFTRLSVSEYNGSTVISRKHPERFFGRYQLVLTTYGMMRNNIDLLCSYCFEYVVLDESQHIKNSDSLTFLAAIRLECKHRLVLTGTPIENSLKDLWAQFRFLQPDLLGEESVFQKRFIAPVKQGNRLMEARLQQLIAPFILRRSKREVAPELPVLTEETIYCDMSEKQKEYYEQEKNSLRNILLQQPHATGRTHTFSILNGILRLRQLACHPRLIIPGFNGYSGKAEQIIDTFDTLRSEGHKVLIFSSFVSHLEILADVFRERGWKYALLTGATNDRPKEIAHFTEQEDVQAFLISLKAGGVGLNLTQADYVFIIDPWWNPAAESQAIARAHRIGQEKQVIAYRFITQGSIEEKILHLQESKRKLAETFITDSGTLPELTNEEWAELLK